MLIRSGDALLRRVLTSLGPHLRPPLLQTAASSEVLRPPEDPHPQTPGEIPTEQVPCCADSGMQQQC